MEYILSSPVIISLELTPLCNSRCPGCSNVYQQHRKMRPPMSARKWREIFEVIAPSVHQLRLTGGEPTLHPQFNEVLSEVAAFGLHFTLFTNALWEDPGKIIHLLKDSSTCTGLLVSLHGANALTHEAFTHVPGSFEQVTTNIKRATEAGIEVTTSTVITRQNYQQIEAIVNLSRKLGADHATFSRYLGREMPAIEPDNTALKQAVQDIELLRAQGQRLKFGDCIPQCFTPSSSRGCLAGVAYCSIDPWGNLRPCTQANIKCGNLLEVSLEEAWNSPSMQYWRSLVPPACEQECAAFSQCHGGCRATALIREIPQDPLMTHPLSPKELPAPESIDLYDGLRPVAHAIVREEPFGYVALGPGLALLTPAGKALLDKCNGDMTLKEIKRQYGHKAIDMIVDLWQKGIVEWA
jgi:radical SAM protein with 4Fe4S-binding SPASM domain